MKNKIQMLKFLQLKIKVKFECRGSFNCITLNSCVEVPLIEIAQFPFHVFLIDLNPIFNISISCVWIDIDPILPNFHFMFLDRS